ncbi:16205_t:CDS:2 [Entrophospora sp. SA101]|nr:16205_t:CDS:2 [Entrophospora sp. SA101]
MSTVRHQVALDYTIVAFYSFIALIPLSVLVAKKDDFTNSCELKPDYDVDCRTLLYFAVVVKTYMLKRFRKRDNGGNRKRIKYGNIE